MFNQKQIFTIVLLAQLTWEHSLEDGQFPVSRSKMTELMVKVITCMDHRLGPGYICLQEDIYDDLSKCVQISVEPEHINQSEVKTLYGTLIRERRHPRTPPYHADVFVAISGLIANHSSFEMMFKWEGLLRSVSLIHFLPNHEYLQFYCYYSLLVQRCTNAAYVAYGVYRSVNSLVQKRKRANSSSIEAAVKRAESDRDIFIDQFIQAYTDMRVGAVGDVIPLVLRSIEIKLPIEDEISLVLKQSAVIVYEQIKLLYRDGFDLQIKEVKKHLMLDPLERIIHGEGSHRYDWVNSDSWVLADKKINSAEPVPMK